MANRYFKAYPNESVEVSVAEGDFLCLSHRGEGQVSIYQRVDYPQHPSSWTLSQTVQNEEVTLDLGNSLVRIDAGADGAYYSMGANSLCITSKKFFPNPINAPWAVHELSDDFDYFVAGSWTQTDQATPTVGLIDGRGGILRIANDVNDTDFTSLIKLGESYLFQTTSDIWYDTRIKTNDVTDSTILFGLVIKSATDPVGTAPTDGVYFSKADGAAAVVLKVVKNSTATTTATLTSLANDTWKRLGFHYSAADGAIYVYVNGVLEATVTTLTNLPDDEEVTVYMAIENGAAASKQLDTDYIYAAQNRVV